MTTKTISQLWRFAAAGGLGFAIEASVVWFVTSDGWNPLSARAVSFPLASFFTWVVNRQLAFKNAGARSWGGIALEYRRYLLGQLVGAAANLLVYSLVVVGMPDFPVLSALSAAAAIGLIVNFFLARAWIFRPQND